MWLSYSARKLLRRWGVSYRRMVAEAKECAKMERDARRLRQFTPPLLLPLVWGNAGGNHFGDAEAMRLLSFPGVEGHYVEQIGHDGVVVARLYVDMPGGLVQPPRETRYERALRERLLGLHETVEGFMRRQVAEICARNGVSHWISGMQPGPLLWGSGDGATKCPIVETPWAPAKGADVVWWPRGQFEAPDGRRFDYVFTELIKAPDLPRNLIAGLDYLTDGRLTAFHHRRGEPDMELVKIGSPRHSTDGLASAARRAQRLLTQANI